MSTSAKIWEPLLHLSIGEREQLRVAAMVAEFKAQEALLDSRRSQRGMPQPLLFVAEEQSELERMAMHDPCL